jgi:putative ABC transport system substrate-binding protein
LFNPATAPFARYYLTSFNAAAVSLGVEPIAASVHSESELESVIAAQTRDIGLISMPDGFLNVHREELVMLAARYRLPAVYPWRFFPGIGWTVVLWQRSARHVSDCGNLC